MARILSITDDAPFQGALAGVLFRCGHEGHYAFNGQEGYEKILRLRPDAVLLDWAPAALSAPELLVRLGAHRLLRGLPVIVLAVPGSARARFEASVSPESVRAYLDKPVRFSELLSKIREVCEPGARALPRGPAKGDLALDLRLGAVWARGRLAATLTPRRARLLEILLRARGAVRRETLLRGLWPGGGGANRLDKAVSRLRAALGPEAARLRTTSGGYELA